MWLSDAVSYSAQMSSSATRVVSAVGLNDIVFYKGSGGPSVESNQAVIISIYGSGVVDGTAQRLVTFLAANISH